MKYVTGDVIQIKYIYFTSAATIGCIIEIYQGQNRTMYKVVIAGAEKIYYWLTDSDISHKL